MHVLFSLGLFPYTRVKTDEGKLLSQRVGGRIIPIRECKLRYFDL
jgi:hypothetical protein